jgi:hypothetical protein
VPKDSVDAFDRQSGIGVDFSDVRVGSRAENDRAVQQILHMQVGGEAQCARDLGYPIDQLHAA